MVSKYMFSKLLNVQMEVRGYSTLGLARKSGLAEQTIRNWVDARSAPSITSASIIKDALGCTWEELLGR